MGEVVGFSVLMEVGGLDAMGAMDMGDILIDIPSFHEEVRKPTEDFVDACRNANFMTIEVVKGVRVGGVFNRGRGGDLNVAEAFVNGGKEFENELEPLMMGKGGIGSVVWGT
jgi:hypothetical protein